MKSSTLTQLIIASVVFVGASGACALWYAKVATERAAVASLDNQISAQAAAGKRVAAAQAALSEISGDEAAVQAYFVSDANIVSFINDLEARGTALNSVVSVNSVSAGTATAHSSLSLALAINGSFDAVLRTIGAIEYAPYAIRVSSMSLSQISAGSWHANLNLLVGSAPAPKS